MKVKTMKKFYILKLGRNIYIKELTENEYKIIQNFISELDKPDFTINSISDSYTKLNNLQPYDTKEEAMDFIIKELYDM